jgi:hypothetical protein
MSLIFNFILSFLLNYFANMSQQGAIYVNHHTLT